MTDQPEAGCAPHLDMLIDAYREQIAGRSPEDAVSVLASELYPAMPSTLAVHLAAAVRRLFEAHAGPAAAYRDGLADGLAEGRRQATEGWEREWAVVMEADWYFNPRDGLYPVECDSEEAARQRFQRGAGTRTVPGRTVVSRLVGPWEPAEQTEAGA